MKTFPINLRLEGMRVLMVGGGAVALEKLEKLLPHRPCLTLVSPEVCPEVATLIAAHGCRHIQDVYRPEHLEAQQLVIGATNDREVNRRLHADTRARGLLLNAVDMPAYCDFIMPAVVAGEHFSVAISTGGVAAGMARQVRLQLEESVRAEDGILEVLEKVRALLKRKFDTVAARKARMWQMLNELERVEREGDPARPPLTANAPVQTEHEVSS